MSQKKSTQDTIYDIEEKKQLLEWRIYLFFCFFSSRFIPYPILQRLSWWADFLPVNFGSALHALRAFSMSLEFCDTHTSASSHPVISALITPSGTPPLTTPSKEPRLPLSCKLTLSEVIYFILSFVVCVPLYLTKCFTRARSWLLCITVFWYTAHGKSSGTSCWMQE